MSSFYDKFIAIRKKKCSLLCVGLDPDFSQIPSDTPGKNPLLRAEYFLKTIIEATEERAVAWKPNLAFFESLGQGGFSLLKTIVAFLRSQSPDSQVILDAKRGDIGNTARHYARALFEELNGDAATLSPYMGMDTLEAFLEYKDKAVIVLCHTSNPGADWLQGYGNPPLYLHLAESLARHPSSQQIWLVVGATCSAKSISQIRKSAPNLPFLVPGIGAQGGKLSVVLDAAGPDILVNVGRSILYAADSIADTAQAANKEASAICKQMQEFLKKSGF